MIGRAAFGVVVALVSFGCSESETGSGDGHLEAGATGGAAAADSSVSTGGTPAAGSGGMSPGSGGAAGAGGATGSGGTVSVDSGQEGGVPETGLVLVGSGSWGGGDGAITVLRLDYGTALLSPVERFPVGGLQSFLAFDRARSAVYAADEAEGVLRRLALDQVTGLVEHDPAHAVATSGNPVYVSVNEAGTRVLVAHYDSGEAEVFPVTPGGLGPRADLETPGSQAHSIVLSPDERFAFVPSKGSDRVAVYSFDAASGALEAAAPAFVATASGSGPRHFTFHPGGAFAYLVNELDNTVNAYAYDASTGALSLLQTVDTLPEGEDGPSTAADVHITPSGTFLYASNRIGGENGSIVAYRVGSDGRLAVVNHTDSRGRTPRNFCIDPTGTYLLVANQDSEHVEVFRIDPESGELEYLSGREIEGSPFFVRFW